MAAVHSFVFRRRLIERLYKEDFKVCPNCLYSLRSCTREKCPECGTIIVIEDLRENWQRTVGLMIRRGKSG